MNRTRKLTYKLKLIELSLMILAGLLLSSCLSQNASSKRSTSKLGIVNNSSSVDTFYGRVLHDNPIILSGNANLKPPVELRYYLKATQDFITNQNTLIGFCTNYADPSYPCFRVLEDQFAPPLVSTDYKWAFTPGTTEFDQVHTFYHFRKIIDRFQNNMSSYYNYLYVDDFGFPKTPDYTTSIPSTLYSQNGNWDPLVTLEGYPWSDISNNAYFSPSDFTVHFGFVSSYPSVLFVHDPSVIYHEVGHALVKVMLNMRNTAYGSNTQPLEQSELGYYQYDEAGAINEGISDFMSHYINERSRFSEWALGLINFSRPISEDDDLHMTGISTDTESRLSYPTFLNYEPNEPETVIEDIHNAGMITSHFLVALTKSLNTTCAIGNYPIALNMVMRILNETLSEMGDLTATGNNNSTFKINLDSDNSKEWIRIAKPINYYTFFQTLARKVMLLYGDSLRCNGYDYPQDTLESLLDSYGLLLFKNYNEDGNDATFGHLGTNTIVNPANRLKSILIGKDSLILDPTDDAYEAYLYDDRTDMVTALTELTGSLQVTDVSPHLDSDLPYNNGNGKISPGELVGLALNLYNNSNTTMAGVTVLANDWDHFKSGKPCNTFEDLFPLSSAGAANSSSEANPSLVQGDCNYITRDNGISGTDVLYPVCFIELSDDDATKWVSQEEFRSSISLPKSECLSGDTTQTKDCFVRALKGADQAWYSKIDPNSTWTSTLSNDGEAPSVNYSNIIFFEISTWIPPGTKFNCRLRARFTNCTDCYTDISRNDLDDYLDYLYAGPSPFKIINFQFTVTD